MSTADLSELTARDILRTSKDRSGRERSNQQQHTGNRAAWPFTFVGDSYREVGSASPYARKERDEFPQLLDDLATGRYGADVLVMWEGSRGSRKVEEWLPLINACETAGVLIAITDHERIYNPTNARDRKELVEIANDAEFESRQLSGRVRRDAATVAANGRSIGPVIYGYRRVYDPQTREFIRQEPDPTEAPHIRELFARLEAGHSARAIARDWDDRGIRTRAGGRHGASNLTRQARNVAYIGRRYHLPYDQWKALDAAERRKAATSVEAWEPLVTERQFHAVQRILGDPARRTAERPGRAVHAFSMIVRCDVCTGPLAVGFDRAPGGHYYCRPKGCVMVSKPEVDDIIEAALFAWMEREDNAALMAVDVDDAEVEAARLEVVRIQVELDELDDAVGAGEVSARMAARSEPQILARLGVAEARLGELSTPPVLRGLVGCGPGAALRWRGMPVAAQRRAAAVLLSPDWLGEVRVGRNARRGVRSPVVDRLGWWVRCRVGGCGEVVSLEREGVHVAAVHGGSSVSRQSS